MYHLIYDPSDDDDDAYMIASEDDTYLTHGYPSIVELFEEIDDNIADPVNDTPFFEWQADWISFKILISFPSLPTFEQIQAQHPELLI